MHLTHCRVGEAVLRGRISEIFRREVNRYRWRNNNVPKETLQKLQGITVNSSMGLPFGRAGTASSIRKYCITGQRYLCFCAHAYRLGQAEAEAELAMHFTDEQWSLMCDVMHEADDATLDGSQATDYVEDGGYASRDDESDEEGDDGR